MKKALIRFEDVSPGGSYASEESLNKLKVIGDYLESQNIPFHISVIPRFVDPTTGYDKSIADVDDPYIIKFIDTINYLSKLNTCAIGMHGYTHQYANSVSGVGYEFAYPSCSQNCPPSDSWESCYNKDEFSRSYASSRMRQGYEAFKKSGINIGWGFSTPHYMAYDAQRCILESWSGLFFEGTVKRNIKIYDTDMPFYRGVIYVPTPLDYVSLSDPEKGVQRICNEINDYTSEDIAAFFFHPILEFDFIEITGSGAIYSDKSYLKRLLKCFIDNDFTFVPLTSLINFIPSSRETNIFPGKENIFFTGKTHGNSRTQLIIWKPNIGSWYVYNYDLENFPDRQVEDEVSYYVLALSDWAKGNIWNPLIGDFNGDGKDDIIVYYPQKGQWQVALSNSDSFEPSPGPGNYIWLDNWAKGDNWVPFIGDFNGDGKDDILVWNPNNGEWQVALSTGDSFEPSTGPGNYIWLDNWAKGDNWVPLVGDFDGDGKDDIVVWNPNNGEWQVALSTGNSFEPSVGPGNYIWLDNWAKGSNWQALIGDFNGDGINDILVVDIKDGDWQIAICTGDKFIPYNGAFRPWCANSNAQPFVVDFNGDGKTGILARHPYLRNGTLDVAVSVVCNYV